MYNTDDIVIQEPLVKGDKYIVTWDGTEYTCVCDDDGYQNLFIGNSNYDSDEDPDAIPFVMYMQEDTVNNETVYKLQVNTLDTSATHTITICHIDIEKKLINEDLLPVLYNGQTPVSILDVLITLAGASNITLTRQPVSQPAIQK